MREIKFRAWDPFSKKMDYDCSDSLSLWNGLLVPEGDCFPMQFTGLKDRAGKEIFEGDIVKAPSGVRWQIAFGNCRFYLFSVERDLLPDHSLDDEQYNSGLEVIGNVHENGDLLK